MHEMSQNVMPIIPSITIGYYEWKLCMHNENHYIHNCQS